RDVLRQPKAHAHPEFARLLHVRYQQLEMIEPLRHGAMMMLEGDDEAGLEIHGRAELDRRPAGVRDMQRAPLMRDIDPIRRQAGALEKRLGLLQILLGEHAHADTLGARLATRALEHETVVTRFGDAAEKDGLLVLI